MKKLIISNFLSVIPYPVLLKLIHKNIILPYYHIVSNNKIPHIDYLYDYKNTNQFKNDLDYLLKNYEPITLNNLIAVLKGDREITKRSFHLSFDDGLREMYDVVYPILLAKGVSATFFINSDFIDNKNMCYQHKASLLQNFMNKEKKNTLKSEVQKIFNKYKIKGKPDNILSSIKYNNKVVIDEIAEKVGVNFREYIKEKEPYLTSDQINSLIKDGFTIGAHSKDHPLYADIALEDQVEQTIESIKYIRNKFNLGYGVFAFPHGDNNVSRKFFNIINETGLIDMSFGTGNFFNDIIKTNIQRISFEKPIMKGSRIIKYQCARILFRKLKGKDTIIRE